MDPRVKPEDDKGEFKPEDDKMSASTLRHF
jgi:hypothetical protein